MLTRGSCPSPLPPHANTGGADYGLAQAVDEGLVMGPRLLFVGHALSQTGGHGDMRGGWGGGTGRHACTHTEARACMCASTDAHTRTRTQTHTRACAHARHNHAHTQNTHTAGKGEDCFACGAALRGIGRVCDGDAEVGVWAGLVATLTSDC
jgi:hypothetical protein